MSLSKEQKEGFANNANLCLVQAHALLQEVLKKKELSKAETNAMLIASHATLTIAIATLTQAFVANMEESLIMRAAGTTGSFKN